METIFEKLNQCDHHIEYFKGKSGAYALKIIKADVNSEQSRIKLTLLTEENKSVICNIYLIKKDGTESIKYGTWIIKDLVYNLKIDQITLEAKNDGFSIPEFKDKVVGIFLEKKVILGFENPQKTYYSIETSYDVDTKRTAKESIHNIEATEIAQLQQKHRGIPSIPSVKSSKNENIHPGGF
jgi:hypothetical protein